MSAHIMRITLLGRSWLPGLLLSLATWLPWCATPAARGAAARPLLANGDFESPDLRLAHSEQEHV